MGAKNDLVVWLRLQPAQQRIYEVLTCPPPASTTLDASMMSQCVMSQCTGHGAVPDSVLAS